MSAESPIQDLNSFWNQTRLPVVFQRQRPAPLLVRLPYVADNKVWLRAGQRIRCIVPGKCRKLGLSEPFVCHSDVTKHAMSSNSIARKKFARQPAGMQLVLIANALAWVPITDQVSLAVVGTRLVRLLQ
jgi:hypothetical protein